MFITIIYIRILYYENYTWSHERTCLGTGRGQMGGPGPGSWWVGCLPRVAAVGSNGLSLVAASRPGLWPAHTGGILWAEPGWGARGAMPGGPFFWNGTLWPPWPLVKQLRLFLMRRPLCLCIPVDNNNFSLAAFRYFSLSLVFNNLTIVCLRVL